MDKVNKNNQVGIKNEAINVLNELASKGYTLDEAMSIVNDALIILSSVLKR